MPGCQSWHLNFLQKKFSKTDEVPELEKTWRFPEGVAEAFAAAHSTKRPRIDMSAPESAAVTPKPFSPYYTNTGRTRLIYLDKKPYTVGGVQYHVVHQKPMFVRTADGAPVPGGGELWQQLVKAYYKRAAAASKKTSKKKSKYSRKGSTYKRGYTRKYSRRSTTNSTTNALLRQLTKQHDFGGRTPTIIKI